MERVVLNAFAKISTVSVVAAVPAAIASVCRRPAFAKLRRGKHVRQPDGLVRGEPATTGSPTNSSRRWQKSGCVVLPFLVPTGNSRAASRVPKSGHSH